MMIVMIMIIIMMTMSLQNKLYTIQFFSLPDY